MRIVKALGVLLASAVIGSASVPVAYAQGESGGGGVYGGGSVGATWMRGGIAPRKAGTAEACPGMMWDIVRSAGPDNSVILSGPVWNMDDSGVSMAKGEARPDGSFTTMITSIQGRGPAGTVTGFRHQDGSLDMKMVGDGQCNNVTMHVKPGETSSRP